MTLKRQASLALALALALAAGTAQAAEKTLDKAAMPPKVLEAVAARYPGANMTRFEREDEDGRTVFEVKVDGPAGPVELEFTPDAALLVEELTLAAKDLPEAVTRALAASPYAAAEIQRVEKVIETGKADAPTFELKVQQGESRHGLIYSATGELLKVWERKKHAHPAPASATSAPAPATR